MKKLLLTLLCLFMFLSITNTFALSGPNNLSLEKVSDTWITITWDEVSDSIGYYIYYSDESSVDWTYKNEWIDLIEETSYKIEWLTPDKDYYIAVTAVDGNWDETVYSEELVAKTLTEWDMWEWMFGLDWSPKIDSLDKINLVFNSELDTSNDAVREFRIIDKSNGQKLSIDSIELWDDNNELILTVSPDMVHVRQYEMTIVVIEDVNGRNISSWVNWIIDFTVPESFEEVCWNWVVWVGEECDDWNVNSWDWCSRTCEVEIALPECWNYIVEDGEECDDWNTVSWDWCSRSCKVEVISSTAECWNSIVEDGEECDDWNTVSWDWCSETCEVEENSSTVECWNSIVEDGEECDDWNTVSWDWCSETCKIDDEEPELCSAWVEEWSTTCYTWWNAWENISNKEIINTPEEVGKDIDDLPKGWPEHILLVILAMILWLVMFKFQRRRQEG